jgi:hexosaminidase
MNDEVYTFLDQLFREVKSLFPAEYIHIGGDETFPEHWNANKAIKSAMAEKGLKTPNDLQAYFNFSIQQLLARMGRKMMGWDEILHPQLGGKEILVQGWRSREASFEAVKLNFDAINSAGWYLDYKLHADQLYSVDPQLNPDAITIDADSTNWRAYSLEINIRGSNQPGLIFLFGEGKNLRGIMRMMDRTSVLVDPKLKDNILTSSMKSSFGNMNIDLALEDETVQGFLKIALFKLTVNGKKIGGSDMSDGIALPTFKKTEAPSETQLARIKGGEACLWTKRI